MEPGLNDPFISCLAAGGAFGPEARDPKAGRRVAQETGSPGMPLGGGAAHGPWPSRSPEWHAFGSISVARRRAGRVAHVLFRRGARRRIADRRPCRGPDPSQDIDTPRDDGHQQKDPGRPGSRCRQRLQGMGGSTAWGNLDIGAAGGSFKPVERESSCGASGSDQRHVGTAGAG